MNRRSLLLSAGAAGLAACATRTAAQPRFAHAATVDAAAAQAMQAAQSIPGLALAIYTRNGGYARGYGLADVETGAPATADTAFYIASTTKPLTALAFAKLHDAGGFDLDQTLAAYAPEAPFPAGVRANEATFRHLFAHTHGIANGPIGFRVAYTGQHDPDTLWRLLGASEVNEDAPLGRYQYTNVGYNIATVLSDRRMGLAWQDLLQREVFRPLGMTRTSARMSDAQTWTPARPHAMGPTGAPVRIYLEKTDRTMQSAGGVVMSANDALRWLECLCEDGRIGARQAISPSVIAATRAPLANTGEDNAGAPVQYGLGWHITQHSGEPAYYHSGGFAGFRSSVTYSPQRGVGVALFANDNSFAGPAIDALTQYVLALSETGGEAQLAAALQQMSQQRAQIVERVAQDRANRAQRPWTLTRPRAAYAGLYRSDLYGDIEVSAAGEALRVDFGVLHAIAEPFTQPDSIRLELVPGQGTVLLFEGDADRPASLRYQGARFSRT